MVPYLKLSNNTLIITLPNGPITLTPNNFNYWKILAAIQSNSSIDTIQSLIIDIPPDAPVVYGYLLDNKLAYSSRGGNFIYSNGFVPLPNPITSGTYLGPFLSIDDVLSQFPEYLL